MCVFVICVALARALYIAVTPLFPLMTVIAKMIAGEFRWWWQQQREGTGVEEGAGSQEI